MSQFLLAVPLLTLPPQPCLISSITLFRGLALLCAIGYEFAPLKL